MTSDQWWTDRRIDSTVDEIFIRKILDAKYQRTLKARVFDDDLSDETYLDWILTKGRRCFLILREIGHPELIFDLIDKSFTDDDVPIAFHDEASWEAISSIRPRLDGKFASKQYYFSLQELETNVHVDYADAEYVPATVVEKGIRRGLVNVKKVMVGKQMLFRRKYPLDVHGSSREEMVDPKPFRYYFHELSLLQHSHITRIWTTYTQGLYGFVLYAPTSADTLRDALSDSEKYFKKHATSKEEQRQILLRWAFCSACALDYMHQHGLSHQAIRPSNIYLDNTMNLTLGESAAFEDFGDLRPDGFERLQYLHGSPEQWQRKRQVLQAMAPIQPRPPTGGRSFRPDPVSQQAPRLSAALFKKGGSTGGASHDNPSARPMSPLSTVPPIQSAIRSYSPGRGSSGPSLHSSSGSSVDYDAGNRQSMIGSSRRHQRLVSENGVYENPTRPRNAIISPLNFSSLATSSNDQSPLFPSDVFALATILVEILTVLLSTTSTSFSFSKLVSHLGKRNRAAGRGGGGGAPADSSFHANLDQAYSWLDTLSKGVADALHKTAKKKSKSKSKEVETEDDSHWLHATAELIELARHGMEFDPRRRITAAEFHAEMVRINERHAVGAGQCCGIPAPAIIEQQQQQQQQPPQIAISEPERPRRTRGEKMSANAARRKNEPTPVIEGFSPTRTRTMRSFSDPDPSTPPTEYSYSSASPPNRPLPHIPELEGDRHQSHAKYHDHRPPRNHHGIMDVANMQVVGRDRYEAPPDGRYELPSPGSPGMERVDEETECNESLYEYFSDEEEAGERRGAKSPLGKVPSLKDIPLPDAWKDKRDMVFRINESAVAQGRRYDYGSIGNAL